MRLFYSAGSPYARIVRIAIIETGLNDRVTQHEISRVRLYSPESDVLAFNPVGRVPTLELDDGTILTESKLILDYIDAVSGGPPLLPRDGSDGWRVLAEAGQAWGLLDGVVAWIRASGQPEIVAKETIRANRAADALEIAVAGGAYAGPLNAAQIVLGAALGLVGPRLPVWLWRAGRPSLSAWFDAMTQKSSFRSTVPPPL